MSITLTVGTWISHDNMLLSAARFYEKRSGRRLAIRCDRNAGLPLATFLLEADGRRAFLDYNDRFELEPFGADADLYAKRSLRPEDEGRGIFPLGFHFNYSFDLHRLLLRPGFAAPANRTEIARAVDAFGLTGWSHFSRRIDHMFVPPSDHGGRALFHARLWDPSRNRDPEEQDRRRRMNEIRLEAVRSLRKMENTVAGIIPDDYSRRTCPELLLAADQATSKVFGAELRRSDIGIVNEGLRGSPGWKIGEYVAGSKAVLSNSIESVVPGFESGTHYLRFDDPREIPDLVSGLRATKDYRRMQLANWEYTRAYLHPERYFARILERLAS